MEERCRGWGGEVTGSQWGGGTKVVVRKVAERRYEGDEEEKGVSV